MIKNYEEFVNILSNLGLEYIFSEQQLYDLYKIYANDNIPIPNNNEYNDFKNRYSLFFQELNEVYGSEIMFVKFYEVCKLVPENIAKIIFPVFLLDVDPQYYLYFLKSLPPSLKYKINIDENYNTVFRNLLYLLSFIFTKAQKFSLFSIYETDIIDTIFNELIKELPVFTNVKQYERKKIYKLLNQLFIIIKYYGTLIWIKFFFNIFGYDVELIELMIDFDIDNTIYYNKTYEYNIFTNVFAPNMVDMYIVPYNRYRARNCKLVSFLNIEYVLNDIFNKVKADIGNNASNSEYLNGVVSGENKKHGIKDYIKELYNTLQFKTNRVMLNVIRVIYDDVPLINAIINYIDNIIPYYLSLQSVYKFMSYSDDIDNVYTDNVRSIYLEVYMDVVFGDESTNLLPIITPNTQLSVSQVITIPVSHNIIEIPYLFSTNYINSLSEYKITDYFKHLLTPNISVLLA